MQHTLSPRSRGIYLAITELKSHVDVIYDITIAYDDSREKVLDEDSWTRKPSPVMSEFLLANRPRVHVDINKINMADVPANEQDIASWLHGLFVRKDRYVCHELDTLSLLELSSHFDRSPVE